MQPVQQMKKWLIHKLDGIDRDMYDDAVLCKKVFHADLSNTRDSNRALKAELAELNAKLEQQRQDFTTTKGSVSKRPKLLILGSKRHGKDTAAEYLHYEHGMRFTSSSLFVAQECLWDQWGKYNYKTFGQMFRDRVNHRTRWADMIEKYNTPDATRTVRTMFERGNDIYVGMRRMREFEACKAAGLFDCVLWIQDPRKPEEESSSFNIPIHEADYVIRNGGTKQELYSQLSLFFWEYSHAASNKAGYSSQQ